MKIQDDRKAVCDDLLGICDFHQRAIEDVARAYGVSIDDVKYYMRPGMSSSKLAAYAVAQRERVLQLEEILTELLRIYRDGDSPREDYWIPIMEAALHKTPHSEKAKL